MKIKLKLMITTITPVVVLVTLCIVLGFTIKKMAKTADMVTHTYNVIGHTELVVLSMVNKETGLRGFLMSGNEEYLEPYYAGLKEFASEIESVKKLVSDNPAQVERFTEVEALGVKWNEYAKKMIALQKSILSGKHQRPDLLTELAKLEGKASMDAIREKLKLIISIEEGLMQQREAESLLAVQRAWSVITIAVIITLVIAAFSLFLVFKGILAPVAQFSSILKDIAEGDGDLTKRVELNTQDELSEMANYLNKFLDNLHSIIEEIQSTVQSIASSAQAVAQVSGEIQNGAQGAAELATNASSSTDQMTTNITTTASASEEMSVNANEVAGAAEQTSQNMNAVSSSVEEMSVSIGQIAKDTGIAREVAQKASGSSGTATSSMESLSEAAKEIGNVTEVIKRIAEQTNLLALNATIEAASAGEAGKGFAVVANEIKELANQSAQAADDIARRITGVQSNTENAVIVIQDVSEIISQIEGTVLNIATAVEQQSKAVNDISANVTQASIGTQNIAGSIAEVAKGSTDVSRNSAEMSQGANSVLQDITDFKAAAVAAIGGAGQLNEKATELAEISESLKVSVDRFKL